MTIRLLNNMSPPNYVSKSISPVTEIEGTLRDPTSILNPNIIIERSDPTGFNYFYIPEFKRYYFLDGVSSEYNNLVAISGTVDVLMSYASEIKAFNAVVKRNENRFNLNLDDGIFKAYQNSKHKIIAFPNGFTDYSYILALAGNGDS